ncbi:Peptidase S49 [gamma proteobacterium HdN1]|nr:Peptidase S49 [gamma proteobacterium HdN1]
MDEQQQASNSPSANHAVPVNPKTEREWKLIEKLLMEGAKEQKRARRWGIFFKLLMFVYFFVALAMFSVNWDSGEDSMGASSDHVGVVDLDGMIMAGGDNDADQISKGLQRAFKAQNSKAVLLRINSPGGSPVQSATIYREIKRLRAKYPSKKLYAVITDVGASGAYYVAAAADEIYADPSSLVGSIGVISEGFGFVGGMEKLGIERRLITSGKNKAFLDPFSPLAPAHKAYFSEVLNVVHQQFINAVKDGRGDRLKDSPDMFSGLVWSGEQALPLGLIDGYGSPGSVVRDVIHLKKTVDYTAKTSPFESFARSFGASFGKSVAAELGLTSDLQLR